MKGYKPPDVTGLDFNIGFKISMRVLKKPPNKLISNSVFHINYNCIYVHLTGISMVTVTIIATFI